MMNMVDNAIYYTPSGGTVTIQLYVDARDVVFKVVDTGIGVPKREQHKLFTKFFRAGNARKARPDGTGLGLFMAQKIIVEQGGSIIFESDRRQGKYLRIPLPSRRHKSLVPLNHQQCCNFARRLPATGSLLAKDFSYLLGQIRFLQELTCSLLSLIQISHILVRFLQKYHQTTSWSATAYPTF
jgi:hypothetical protein